jgi:hypothetical protein
MAALPEMSEKFQQLYSRMNQFVKQDCIAAEAAHEQELGQGAQRWLTQPRVMEDLKQKAKTLGLWNLFLSKEYKEGAGLTNLEYALLAELTGWSPTIAPEVQFPTRFTSSYLVSKMEVEMLRKWITLNQLTFIASHQEISLGNQLCSTGLGKHGSIC